MAARAITPPHRATTERPALELAASVAMAANVAAELHHNCAGNKAVPGWRARIMATWLSAAKLLARHAPSLAFVVLEEQLPGTTGLAFAARIRESQPDLPIIVLTLGEEPGATARPSGPFAAIKKPFRWKGFSETVQRLLA